MKKLGTVWCIAAGLFLSMGLFMSMAGQAFAQINYKIDSAHTFVEFRISHLGFSWMIGTFDKVSGEFSYDPKSGDAPSVFVTIDTASIDTSHAERDKHLRSPDFLDVEKFPTATFVSHGFKEGVLSGDLTLHGITKAVQIPVKLIGEGKGRRGGYNAGFEGAITIDRRDFGLDKNLGPASWILDLFFSIEGNKVE